MGLHGRCQHELNSSNIAVYSIFYLLFKNEGKIFKKQISICLFSHTLWKRLPWLIAKKNKRTYYLQGMVRIGGRDRREINFWKYVLYIFNFRKHVKSLQFQRIKLTTMIWSWKGNIKPNANNKWTNEFFSEFSRCVPLSCLHWLHSKAVLSNTVATRNILLFNFVTLKQIKYK